MPYLLLARTELQMKIAETYGYIYDELVSTLYDLYEGVPAKDKPSVAVRALTSAESNKARQFAASWGGVFERQLRQRLPADLQDREQTLTIADNRLREELVAAEFGRATPVKTIDDIKRELANIEGDIEILKRELHTRYAAYAAIRYPEPLRLENLKLREGETVLEYKVADAATYVWTIKQVGSSSPQVRFSKLDISERELSAEVQKVVNSIHPGVSQRNFTTTSGRLSRTLLPPGIFADVVGAKKLVIIPDGPLFLIPFELLTPSNVPTSPYPLLAIPTSYYPSAAALRARRIAVSSSTWDRTLFAMADPVTSREDPRFDLGNVVRSGILPDTASTTGNDLVKRGFDLSPLPGTRDEVNKIAQLFSAEHDDVVVRTDMHATRAEILRTDLSRFKFLHFATHALLPVETRMGEPALVLSFDSDDRSMLLSLSDVLGLKLNADMVVLSACNTGRGRISRAEGVSSLAQAFMAAGAASSTVSLWQVADDSTAALMQEFYRNLLAGQPKNVALARARRALKGRGYDSVFYWAPFVLYGE